MSKMCESVCVLKRVNEEVCCQAWIQSRPKSEIGSPSIVGSGVGGVGDEVR